jgi:hypothetical protein
MGRIATASQEEAGAVEDNHDEELAHAFPEKVEPAITMQEGWLHMRWTSCWVERTCYSQGAPLASHGAFLCQLPLWFYIYSQQRSQRGAHAQLQPGH